MIDVSHSLTEQFKRSMKHYVVELKERNDYDVRMSQSECETCGGIAHIPEYCILGQGKWKQAIRGTKIECKSCSEQKFLRQVLKNTEYELHEQLRIRFEEEYWNIPDEMKKAGFRNFEITGGENVLHAKRIAMNYVKEFSKLEPKTRYNLLIMGNPGTGKTHLATAIARTLKEKGLLVGHMTTGTILSKIKATYQKGASKTEEGILNDLRKLDLLVIDDLGSEARRKDEYDWNKNKLFEIVNHRAGQPTIYTSNLNEQHLPTAIGERVFSRLYNNTKFVELVTEDYRKNFLIK